MWSKKFPRDSCIIHKYPRGGGYKSFSTKCASVCGDAFEHASCVSSVVAMGFKHMNVRTPRVWIVCDIGAPLWDWGRICICLCANACMFVHSSDYLRVEVCMSMNVNMNVSDKLWGNGISMHARVHACTCLCVQDLLCRCVLYMFYFPEWAAADDFFFRHQ